MPNNIKCLLNVKNQTVEDIAESAKLDPKLINYYIDNPSEEMNLDVAKALAEFFDMPVKFILGHPCKYKLSLKELHSDIAKDIRKLSPLVRPFYEYLYRGGYYDDPSTLSNKFAGSGFIAMSFNFDNPELCSIRNAFKQAIEQAGYMPVIINELHSNNYITFDIMTSIQKCKFLVLDTTYENHGAYYEAGYAKGLGKQVMICCKLSTFEKRKDHFDINQINHVLWNDEADLVNKLTERIRLTVI